MNLAYILCPSPWYCPPKSIQKCDFLGFPFAGQNEQIWFFSQKLLTSQHLFSIIGKAKTEACPKNHRYFWPNEAKIPKTPTTVIRKVDQ